MKVRVLGAMALLAAAWATQAQAPAHKWAVVLHGGAGVIERSSMTPDAERAYRAGLNEAVTAAGSVLDKGGSAVDAVEAAIKLLEDNPLFNAGRGAVFAADGTNQLDSAIMDGATMKAGAVADVQHTRHPISLARAVMDKSNNVMMIGAGTYASNASCAVSATGTGEYFIRLTVARTICALVQYKGMPLKQAADEVVQKQLPAIHGDGGVIAITPDGQMAWSFNTPGMFRAKLQQGGTPQIGIYRDEP